MLDLSHERQVVSQLWEQSDSQVQMSEGLAKHFFEPTGAMPQHYENHRTFHRYYLRGKAVLSRRDRILGGYTKDVSRNGIGFLSPVQLMPKETVSLRLPTATLQLQVSRCRRISESCYDCGAKFSVE
jgi:hypothetical protein